MKEPVMKRPKVIISACPDYDVDRIERIIAGGLAELDLKPHGRTLVKPNIVASGKLFPHAYTRTEFMEGVLRALKKAGGQSIKQLAVGERCGITIPTRFAYTEADYYKMAKRVGGIEMYHFEETKQVEIPLYHEGRLRDSFFTPEPIAKADFLVNCPKFKAHPWTTVTFSMKNYIGIQDDRHRLIDHDWALNKKVADLQYIVQPQFIAIDAITAGEGRMLTPIPFDLGLVIMGDNQVAFDALCCHIIGVDPMTVEHIRLAHERGFGPIALADFDVVGDVSLDAAKEKAQGFKVGLIRVEEYFKGTNIRGYSGPPPSNGENDYCWGGCPGAVEEAIEILRIFDAQTDTKMPPIHIVFGAYEGEIDAKRGEKVIFMGDCASFHGDIAGQPVDIVSTYLDRATKSVHEAKHEDIYSKLLGVERLFLKHRKEDVIPIRGCPVSVAEQMLALVKLGKLRNPIFDPQYAFSFNNCSLSWRTRTAIQRIFGNPYQQAGATERGESRPKQNLPPKGKPTPLEV